MARRAAKARKKNPKYPWQPDPIQPADVGREVAAANRLYQPASGECLATPAAMKILLDRLQVMTKRTQKEAEENGLAEFYTTQQWAGDMAAWQIRLGRYFAELGKVPADQQNTAEGCRMIYKTVVAPLLDGIWYTTDAPGIVLNAEERARIESGEGHPSPDVTTPDHPGGHSNAKPPDVASPFMLSNGVRVWNRFVRSEWKKFWKEIGKDTADLFHKVFRWTGEVIGKLARIVGEAIGAGMRGLAQGLITGITGRPPGKGGGLGWFAFGVVATVATAGGLYYVAKRRGVIGGGGGSRPPARREAFRTWQAQKDEDEAA